MSSTQQLPGSAPGDGATRLDRAITEASEQGDHESPAVCEAVESVVAEAKEAGQPPERMLAMLKAMALRTLDRFQLPLNGARAIIAWIVRCAVKAYYGHSRPEPRGR